MPWLDHHILAERQASAAEVLIRQQRPDEARDFYAQAAEAEQKALEACPPDKLRTRGILGVSAVALLHKSGQSAKALTMISALLHLDLPEFAHAQLESLRKAIAELDPEADWDFDSMAAPPVGDDPVDPDPVALLAEVLNNYLDDGYLPNRLIRRIYEALGRRPPERLQPVDRRND